MKRVLSLLAVCATLHGFTAAPAIADPEIKNWKTPHSMGCMLLQECTEGVEEVFSLLDVSHEYDNWEDFTPVANEFNNMLLSLNQVGVKVFLADEKYFPEGHRGVYHTVSNNFFLNRKFMNSPATLMMVMRHEGWHAAQDCMAGTIDNSLIAIIKPEDEVPMLWRVLAERTYPKSAVPWEAEAGWAGRTEKMTMNALAACANGNMWEVYEPTPLTREYLEKEGFIK
tara:strand:+ start:1247 stop:1924 length:678 start_codon:yes stop_codon:yes gene_type:complete